MSQLCRLTADVFHVDVCYYLLGQIYPWYTITLCVMICQSRGERCTACCQEAASNLISQFFTSGLSVLAHIQQIREVFLSSLLFSNSTHPWHVNIASYMQVNTSLSLKQPCMTANLGQNCQAYFKVNCQLT